MGLGWSGVLLAIFILLQFSQIVEPKKKIVKLIVPFKIKHIHHTHVLVVRPNTKKKKSTIVHDEHEEDQYHREAIRTRPKLHVVLPTYIAEAKQGIHMKKPAKKEDESYFMSVGEYRRRIPEEAELTRLTVPYENSHKKKRIIYKTSEQQEITPGITATYSTVPKYYTDVNPHLEEYVVEKSPSLVGTPYKYDSDYVGYSSYGEQDGVGDGGWGVADSYNTVPDRYNDDHYSVPEIGSNKNVYREHSYHGSHH